MYEQLRPIQQAGNFQQINRPGLPRLPGQLPPSFHQVQNSSGKPGRPPMTMPQMIRMNQHRHPLTNSGHLVNPRQPHSYTQPRLPHGYHPSTSQVQSPGSRNNPQNSMARMSPNLHNMSMPNAPISPNLHANHHNPARPLSTDSGTSSSDVGIGRYHSSTPPNNIQPQMKRQRTDVGDGFIDQILPYF